jgi:hypothetical protein
MVMVSTQLLTEMSTRNPPGGNGPIARMTTSLPSVSHYVGASMSHNPMGLHSLLQGYFYLTLHKNFRKRERTLVIVDCHVLKQWIPDPLSDA